MDGGFRAQAGKGLKCPPDRTGRESPRWDVRIGACNKKPGTDGTVSMPPKYKFQ